MILCLYFDSVIIGKTSSSMFTILFEIASQKEWQHFMKNGVCATKGKTPTNQNSKYKSPCLTRESGPPENAV